MIWPFRRKPTTETGAKYYLRDAAVADAKALVDFKQAVWRRMFAPLKDEAFFAAAETTTNDQVTFWQDRLQRGDTMWLAEDLRDRIIGTVHATTKHSDHTKEFIETYGLGELHELRYFYLGEAAANTDVGTELIRVALGNRPGITWLAGHAPLEQESLRQAGFKPVGEPVDPAEGPWRGVVRQAMVRT